MLGRHHRSGFRFGAGDVLGGRRLDFCYGNRHRNHSRHNCDTGGWCESACQAIGGRRNWLWERSGARRRSRSCSTRVCLRHPLAHRLLGKRAHGRLLKKVTVNMSLRLLHSYCAYRPDDCYTKSKEWFICSLLAFCLVALVALPVHAKDLGTLNPEPLTPLTNPNSPSTVASWSCSVDRFVCRRLSWRRGRTANHRPDLASDASVAQSPLGKIQN